MSIAQKIYCSLMGIGGGVWIGLVTKSLGFGIIGGVSLFNMLLLMEITQYEKRKEKV